MCGISTIDNLKRTGLLHRYVFIDQLPSYIVANRLAQTKPSLIVLNRPE